MKKTVYKGKEFKCYADGSVESIHGTTGKPHRRFGHQDRYGYHMVTVMRKNVLVHRIIAKAYLSDYDESLQVDHINGLKGDSRPCNLRMATSSENLKAFRKPQGKSKFRGVGWLKKKSKWMARFTENGKQIYAGYFDSEIEAARAWDAKAIELGFKPEALNFPQIDSHSA